MCFEIGRDKLVIARNQPASELAKSDDRDRRRRASAGVV